MQSQSIKERYIGATQSSNLMDDARHRQTDILCAAALHSGLKQIKINGESFARIGAMAGGLGGLLFRVKFGNDAGSYPQLLNGWVSHVTHVADRNHWPTMLKPRKVAITVLNWWINNICTSCDGTGFKKHENPQLRTDDICDCCDGTLIKNIVCEPYELRYAEDVISELSEIDRMFDIGTKNRLRNNS